MCYLDDGAHQCSFTETRRARKSHTCCECGGEIARGDRYEFVSGIWDHHPSSFKTCRGCLSLREAVRIHEIGEGCHLSEATPPFETLMDSASESGLVCFVPWRERYIARARRAEEEQSGRWKWGALA